MAESTATVVNGKLVASRVKDKTTSKIEKGALSKVNAIVVHQTGSDSADSSLNSYRAGINGAHFLIDKDGTIFQTARVDQKCWHVGNIKSRCTVPSFPRVRHAVRCCGVFECWARSV